MTSVLLCISLRQLFRLFSILVFLSFILFFFDFSSEQPADQLLTLLQFLLQDCVLLEDVLLLLHHILQQAFHCIDEFMHLGELFIKPGRPFFGLLNFLLTFFDFYSNLFELTLLLESIKWTPPIVHCLAEPLVSQQAIDNVSTTQVLNFLDISLDSAFEDLDLLLVFLSEFFDILVENFVLALLLL